MSEQKKKTRNQNIFKLVVLLLLIALVVYLCRDFIHDVFVLVKAGDEEAMEAYIKGAGRKGILLMVFLQVLQTITIVFPGIPIYMCAGIIYGRIWGSVICYITYVVSNISVFMFSRRVKETADSITDNNRASMIEELLRKTGHPLRFITLLCVIPVIPNGMIPYIAANADLSLKQFSRAVAVGCIPGIVLFVCCGDLLMTKYFWLVIGLMIAAVVLMILSMVFKSQIGRFVNKIIKKIAK